MSRKNNCLSKKDVDSLIIYWIVQPVVFILILGCIYFAGRWVTKQIYINGCFDTWSLNNDAHGPSFSTCDKLFEK